MRISAYPPRSLRLIIMNRREREGYAEGRLIDQPVAICCTELDRFARVLIQRFLSAFHFERLFSNRVTSIRVNPVTKQFHFEKPYI